MATTNDWRTVGDELQRAVEIEIHVDLNADEKEAADHKISELMRQIVPLETKKLAVARTHRKRPGPNGTQIGLTPWGKEVKELVTQAEELQEKKRKTEEDRQLLEDLDVKISSLMRLIVPEKKKADEEETTFREALRPWKAEVKELVEQLETSMRKVKVPGVEVRGTNDYVQYRTDGPTRVEILGTRRPLDAKEREPLLGRGATVSEEEVEEVAKKEEAAAAAKAAAKTAKPKKAAAAPAAGKRSKRKS